MTKKKIQQSKILNFDFKNLGNVIDDYPFVEIEWLDIEGDAGWSSTKDLSKEELPVCVSKGYLLSQSKGITRMFTDYIKTKDKPTFDNIGNTTIIPTAVIKWVRPPCRVSLNCTDRCHCSLNLVHWFLVSRSRPLITGHWSSSRCSGSWDPCTAQRKLVLVSWPPIFSSLLGWWPGNQQLRCWISFLVLGNG
jgi:hypothetical protein